MKFNKKVIIWMIMILSMLLGGCGASLGSSVKKVKLDPDNPTKVTIWHYYNRDQLEAFNKLIDEFNGSVGKEENGGEDKECSNQAEIINTDAFFSDHRKSFVGWSYFRKQTPFLCGK